MLFGLVNLEINLLNAAKYFGLGAAALAVNAYRRVTIAMTLGFIAFRFLLGGFLQGSVLALVLGFVTGTSCYFLAVRFPDTDEEKALTSGPNSQVFWIIDGSIGLVLFALLHWLLI